MSSLQVVSIAAILVVVFAVPTLIWNRFYRRYARGGTGTVNGVRFRWRTRINQWEWAESLTLLLDVEVERAADVPDFQIVREWGGNAALHDWGLLKEMKLEVPGKAHWDYDHFFSTPDRERLRAYLLADPRRCEAIVELFALPTDRVRSDARGVRVRASQLVGAGRELRAEDYVAGLARLAGG